LAAGLAVCIFGLVSAVAGAAELRLPLPPIGKFAEPRGLAVDQGSHDVYAIDGFDEQQRITITATSGRFKLEFGGNVSKELSFNAVSEEVRDALREIACGGSSCLVVKGGPGNGSGSNPYIVEFASPLATTDVEEIRCVAGSPPLSGASGCAVTTIRNGVNGSVSRYHADGTPAEFTALGSNAIDGLAGPDLTPQKGLHFNVAKLVQVGVDESSDETAGEIYVTQGDNQKLDVFGANGEHLGELTQYEGTPGNEATLQGLGRVCGVAVDLAGDVFVADLGSGIHKYDPKGAVVTNADNVANFTSVESPCGLAAGRGASAGSLFAVSLSSGGLAKLDATSGAVQYEISKGNTTVSVDPTSGNVLTASGSEIKEWDASGAGSATLLGLVSAGSEVTGIAVDGTTPKGKGGTLYLARSGATHLDVYGPYLSLPVPATGPATAVARTTATLHGTISADGGPSAGCHFQYITEATFQAQKKAAEAEDQSPAQATEAAFAGAQSVACEPPGPFTGGTVSAVSGKATGLQPQTEFVFRLVGDNSEGSIPASELEFETQGEPLIKEGAASQVTTSSATISSKVNPRGQATSFSVEFVTQQQFEESEFAGAAVVEGPVAPALVSGKGDLSAATGTGGLAEGFSQIKGVKTESGTFVVGQSIFGAGIKAGTTITSVGAGTLGLSQSVEASGEKVTLAAGSNVITNLSTSAGSFAAGQSIEGVGIPNATTIVSASQTELALSQAVTAPGEGVGLIAQGFEPVSLQLSGLTPDTTYHFRGVAANEVGMATESEPHTFATSVPLGPPLPDERAYELVSPPARMGDVYPAEPYKHDGGSCKSCVAGWNARKAPMQASADGQAVAYEGDPFFGGQKAEANSYVSRRGEGSWGTAALSTPQLEAQVFKAFSPDLSKAIMLQVAPALTTEAPEGFAELYLREEGKGLRTLITSEPPNRFAGEPAKVANAFQVEYAGANAGSEGSEAFSHVIFAANDALTPAAEEKEVAADERDLYEWSGGELRLVNVLPSEEVAAQPVFGSGQMLAAGDETPNFSHAISDSGNRIFWSTEPDGQVYMREGGGTTIELPDHTGKFLTASPDGSKVLLSDGSMYELNEEEGAYELSADLTHGKGGFQGIAGTAEDLARVYFVDTEALTGAEEVDANDEAAEEGAFNLYLWEGEEGEGTVSFIGRLAAEDNHQGDTAQLGAWRAGPGSRLAQASADGRFLAFQSTTQLTPDAAENLPRETRTCIGSGTEGRLACSEVFEYDAVNKTLICASCNPQGERPLGGSTLSLIDTPREFFPQPENLPAEGKGRLFFDSLDALSQSDTNGRIQDVYEFEPAGVGTCTRPKGCLALISGGHGPKDSVFVNASASGDDVFFASRDQLVGADKNDLMDLYDARKGGGLKEEAPAPCAGEACAGPIPAPPPFQAPSSNQVPPEGPVKPAACRKGFVRKGGKCVRRHKPRHHKQRHHRAAKHHRGGAR
jgi:hypothetical protein